MKKIIALVLAVAMVATLFCSCGSTIGDAEGYSVEIKDGKINIGFIAPLTGSTAVYGKAVEHAVDLAVKEINKDNSILKGYTLTLTKQDDQGDATVGTSAFNKVMNKDIAALIGPVTTGVTAAVTSLANENGIVMITPTATGDSVTTKSDYVFRSCFKDSSQGTIAAKYAQKLGYKEVSVLYAQGDAYSTGLRDAFVKECKKLGINVAVEMTSPTISDETTFSSQLSQIVGKIGNDGFIFAPYYYDAAGPMIIPEARAQGFKGVIMGTDGYDGMVPDYVTGDLSVYNNVLFTNHYSAESTDEKVQNFVSAYTAANNETPNAFAALAYDATYMLAQSLEKVLKKTPNTVSGDDLKKVMDGMKFNGVTGNFTLDKTGTPDKSAVILSYAYDEATKKVVSKYVETF